MTSPDPTAILAQINTAREQVNQTLAQVTSQLALASAEAAAAARDRAAIQAIAQQTVRVDTSVGTRVFAGDRMIFGDTGWRRMATSPDVESGEVRLRRVGNLVIVWLSAAQLVQGSGFASIFRDDTAIPGGFRTVTNDRTMGYIGLQSNAVLGQRLAAYGPILSWVGDLTTQGGPRPSAAIQGTFTWFTEEPWPTSLPGTVV